MTALLFIKYPTGCVFKRKNGTFIIKIFDAFLNNTINILALLSSFYRTVYITKPSNPLRKPEKYVVCKGFLHSSNAEFYQF
jgi:23S rRNA U2552 (ribose-2'-O)-methylase RlmE/FtsJ